MNKKIIEQIWEEITRETNISSLIIIKKHEWFDSRKMIQSKEFYNLGIDNLIWNNIVV